MFNYIVAPKLAVVNMFLHIFLIFLCITDNDLKGLVFEAGEDMREAGERLAASYANFYIANDIVLVPQFGDVKDKQAVDLIQNLMPEYEVIGVYARDIIVGGGNIHCITQQIPADSGRMGGA